jgi:hypothetical protein
MAITCNPSTKIIQLDSTSVSVAEIWSRWVDWFATSDNCKYLPAMRVIGGNQVQGAIYIPSYFYLLDGWRIRPQESNHTLEIEGNVVVDGGGNPIANTVGTYQVNVRFTVPVQAQAISTTGGTGPSAADVADAVFNKMVESGYSFGDLVRIQHSALAGKVTGAGTATERFRSIADNKDRLVVTVDANGNRTAITQDGSA